MTFLFHYQGSNLSTTENLLQNKIINYRRFILESYSILQTAAVTTSFPLSISPFFNTIKIFTFECFLWVKFEFCLHVSDVDSGKKKMAAKVISQHDVKKFLKMLSTNLVSFDSSRISYVLSLLTISNMWQRLLWPSHNWFKISFQSDKLATWCKFRQSCLTFNTQLMIAPGGGQNKLSIKQTK